MIKNIRILLAGLATLTAANFCGASQFSQSISLRKGWNAFTLHVTPKEDADTLFATWPVQSVSLYDQYAFLRTRQFFEDANEMPPAPLPYLIWHRGNSTISTLRNVAGNGIYICYATNAMPTQVIYGKPVASRTEWRATQQTPGAALNFHGVSMEPGITVPLKTYLAGIDTDYTQAKIVTGLNKNQISLITPISGQIAVSDGMVLVMDSAKVSTWLGAFHVSPQTGIDFGTDYSTSFISIRNDTSTNRTVSLKFDIEHSKNFIDAKPFLHGLYKSISNTWDTLPSHEAPLFLTLAAGETREIHLAVDRINTMPEIGATYGGIWTIRDEDGSGFQTVIPMSATVGEKDSLATADWPTGLWVAELKLDKVSFVSSDSKIIDGVETSSPMRLRLILHKPESGNVQLLQRVAIASRQNPDDGTIESRLYAGTATLPDGWDIMRISTVAMGVDNASVAMTSGGTFGGTATFDFSVAANDRSNPFKHPFHPEHDGLAWDFKTKLPTGDNIENYLSKVKPETFSVANSVTLTWQEGTLDAISRKWTPNETLQGTCRWTLGGLRRQGDLHADGNFTMTRISKIGTVRQ